MQTRLLIFAALLLFLGRSLAATALLPDVPVPALTPDKILAIAQKELGSHADELTLVGIEWCQSSRFKPRYSTGGGWPELDQNPGEYCWFITFVEKPGPHSPVPRAPAAAGKPFRDVVILRVKNDGTPHFLMQIRT